MFSIFFAGGYPRKASQCTKVICMPFQRVSDLWIDIGPSRTSHSLRQALQNSTGSHREALDELSDWTRFERPSEWTPFHHPRPRWIRPRRRRSHRAPGQRCGRRGAAIPALEGRPGGSKGRQKRRRT